MSEEAPIDHSPRVCAVIVAFNPDPGLRAHLPAVLQQVPSVFVIDNGSTDPRSLSLIDWASSLPGVVVERYPSNLGIGHALNRGFSMAISSEFEFVLALDQDSEPRSGMLAKLLAAYESRQETRKIAVVAAQPLDPDPRIKPKFLTQLGRFRFRRADCLDDGVLEVTSAISSGSLFPLKHYLQLGEFREDLFIDYIDTEYCLRALANGFVNLVVCSAHMTHQWGSIRQMKVGPLTARPTFHSPERWYFIHRNRVLLLREYALTLPHWAIYDLVLASWWLVRMLLFEDRKMAKLKAAWQGTIDGILCRRGYADRWQSTTVPEKQMNVQE